MPFYLPLSKTTTIVLTKKNRDFAQNKTAAKACSHGPGGVRTRDFRIAKDTVKLPGIAILACHVRGNPYKSDALPLRHRTCRNELVG